MWEGGVQQGGEVCGVLALVGNRFSGGCKLTAKNGEKCAFRWFFSVKIRNFPASTQFTLFHSFRSPSGHTSNKCLFFPQFPQNFRVQKTHLTFTSFLSPM